MSAPKQAKLMHVLVYGTKGWIGQQFTELLDKEGVKWTAGTARVDDDVAVSAELEKVAPTHAVSFIGRTHGSIGDKKFTTIDYLEQPDKLIENMRDNLLAPITLAKQCADKKVHFAYLGTGCIFEYDDAHPLGKSPGFQESDLPNFTGSSYSTVKGITDRLMHQLFDTTALNVRIRMPITGSPNPRNFITKITTYEKICSMPNSMTVLPTLLPGMLKLMEMETVGTVNLTNPGCISHNEILQLYKDIVDPAFEWKNFSVEEQAKILASARSNNLLETDRLKELLPDTPDIYAAVKLALEDYKAAKAASA
jgi:3,5-epimerase/4-reductase